MLLRCLGAFVLVGLVLSACAAAPVVPTPPTVTPVYTPGPLTKTIAYWDLGLSIKYPDNWAAPQIVAGYLALAPSVEAARGQIQTQPVVYARIADPVRDLRLPKEATLAQIAAAMNTGQGVIVSGGGGTKVAGLDAAYVELTENNQATYGRAFAFRMPDGRVGLIVGVTPADQWADFASTLDQMRAGISLLKATDFTVPVIGSGLSRLFPQAGVKIPLPDGWTDEDLGNLVTARLYRNPLYEEYLDESGFANGPRLVLRSEKMPGGVSLTEALRQLIKLGPGDKITMMTVGGFPAAMYSYTDHASGQIVIFIGFTSQNYEILTLNVFRWTVPGILSEVTRPVLATILDGTIFYSPDGYAYPSPEPTDGTNALPPP